MIKGLRHIYHYLALLGVAVFLFFSITGCTAVRYNGSPSFVRKTDHPPINTVTTAYIGDKMVSKGSVYEENVLVLSQPVEGTGYLVQPGTYVQLGYDDEYEFYSPVGIVHSAFFDPAKALAVKRGGNFNIYVITIYGTSFCYAAAFERSKKLSEVKKSFQQTLLYNGKIGDKLRVGYREFINNWARPAFSNEVEYDMSVSSIIGYKGALIEVISANNNSITYKLLRNFR